MPIDQNITGGAELQAALSSLPAKIEKNIMRAAVRAGAAVLRAEARLNVPVATGALKKSIKISAKATRGQINVKVTAGGKGARHAQLVEYGTRPHEIKPDGAAALAVGGAVVGAVMHPGAQPKPFMRPAFDAKAQEAIAAVAAKIRERLTEQGINTPAPESAPATE